jgi:FAD/FMN-containing dehydrogenase
MRLITTLSIFVLTISISIGIATEKAANDLENCLSREIPEKSVYIGRDSPEYSKYNFQWNTRKGEIMPLGYILTQVPSDVQGSIRCGVELGIRMIPRSGGNSYEKYSFGDSESVIIDLRLLNQLDVNTSTRQIDVGAGVLIGHLYWALWTAGGFGFAGTYCPSVGVGGATLGGGCGYWSKKFGLLSDNVVEMDVVTADGQLQTVDKNTNPDLFWALLGGGGGNFGIVTRFNFKIFEVSDIRVTQINFEYDLATLPQVFAAWQTFNFNARDGTGYARLEIGSDWLTLHVTDNNLTNEDTAKIIAAFPRGEKDPVVSEYNFVDFAAANAYPPMNSSAELGQVTHDMIHKHEFRAKSYFGNKLLFASEILAVTSLLQRVPRDNIIEMSTFGGETNKIPKNATSFVHRDSLFIIQVRVYNFEETSKEWLAEFDRVALEVMESQGSYQNYIDEELKQNDQYLSRYYGTNLEKLVQVKNQVDPDDYFSFMMSIPSRQ